MTTNDTLFAAATRNKFRFSSPRGDLTVEQLWDLPLVSANPNTLTLDTVAKTVNRELKTVADESFVQTAANKQEALLTQKLDLVKQIIAVKIAERDAAAKVAENAAKKAKILEVLAQKQDQALAGQSQEELLKQLAELG